MLSTEEVLAIARLARLELSAAEAETLKGRLSQVLEHVKELSQVPTAQELVRHVPEDVVALREDKAVAFPFGADILENAPSKEANQFLLPAVMEGE